MRVSIYFNPYNVKNYFRAKFDTLKELKQHMSKTHQLFQCDLCTDHYLLFPGERKWYNRADLARHKRKGDPDDKSHKGHPLCTFCDVRFLDEHELYRHLRRDHHLCHICEADNGSREFIKCIDELVRHFRYVFFQFSKFSHGPDFSEIFQKIPNFFF